MDRSSSPKKRNLKPLPAVPMRAAAVSQLTCLAVLGIDPRRYLELLPSLGIPVTEVGKLRVASVDDVQAALRDKATPPESGSSLAVEVDDDDVPTTADGVLALIGRRRVG